jgi:hypothetical protein
MDHRDIRMKGVYLIHLAQDRGRWRALKNTEIKVRVP